jgi:uncharacterized phage protein gp47/JayE
MATITPKSLEEFRQTQLEKWLELLPEANINEDSMIYIDATVFAELAYMMQQDAITITNNAFLAYATGDELTNLGIDRGIPRKTASKAKGQVTFGRTIIGDEDFIIVKGTQLATQPDSS